MVNTESSRLNHSIRLLFDHMDCSIESAGTIFRQRLMRRFTVSIVSLVTYRSRRGIALPARVGCANDGMLTTKRKKPGTTTSVALARQFTSDHPVARACGDADRVTSRVTSPAVSYDSKQQLLARALARRGKFRDEDDYRRKSA